MKDEEDGGGPVRPGGVDRRTFLGASLAAIPTVRLKAGGGVTAPTLRGAAKTWTDTADQMQSFLMPNNSRLAGVAAAWRIFRHGLAVYRFLRKRTG